MGCACAQIVRSLAGHDRGGLFCVLDTDGPYLLLCDGKRRKLENPNGKRRFIPPPPVISSTLSWISSGQAGTYPTETYGGRWPLSELRN